MVKRILILLLICVSQNQAQTYLITNYTDNDGLPSNAVYDLFRDKMGKLWACSDGGIFNYDGAAWNLEVKTDIHKRIYYHRLLLDHYGILWALPSDYRLPLIFYDGRSWNDAKGFPAKNEFKCFARMISTDTTLCVITQTNEILLYQNSTWTYLSLPDNTQSKTVIYSVAGRKNSFLLGTSSGIMEIKDGVISNKTEINEKLPNSTVLMITCSDTPIKQSPLWLLGDTWIGHMLPDGQFVLISDKVNLPYIKGTHSYIFLKRASNGRIYFGNEAAIFYFDKNEKNIKELKYRGDREYRGGMAIEYDEENILWISNYRGINKIRLIPFTNYDSQNGLPLDEVSAIEVLKDGTVLFGQYGSISVLNKNTIREIRFDKYGDPESQILRIMDIKQSADGSVWVAVDWRGIGKFTGSQINWLKDTENLFASSFELDDEGNLIVATVKGIFKIINDKLVSAEAPQDISQSRKIKMLGDNILGICTIREGLYLFGKDSLRNYSSSQSIIRSTYAVNQYQSKILVGTAAGLYEVEGDSLVKSGILYEEDDPIYFIEVSPQNELWLGSSNGLINWDGDRLKKYSKSNGLIGDETNRNAAKFDRLGNFWIGTDLGASYFQQTFDETINTPPEGEIKYLELPTGKQYRPDDNIVLDSDENNLLIHLRCFSFNDEKNNKFFVTLIRDEADTLFNNMFFNTVFKLVSLSPGKYTLKMQAVNSSDIFSHETYSISFSINRPFFLSAYFIVPAIIGSLIIFFFIFSYFHNRKYSVNLQKEVVERTSLLQKEVEEKNRISETLAESENYFRSIFENSSSGIFKSDLNGKFLLANPALIKKLGYNSFEELSAIDTKTKLYTNPSDRSKFIEQLYAKGELLGYEIDLLKKNGQTINVRINARLSYDKEGRPVAEGTADDISEKRIFEQELIVAKDKAEASDKLKSEFLTQMSHEIRTPINTILSFSGLIYTDYRKFLPDEFNIIYHSIHNAGKRIIRTIDLILNMSEMQLGSYHPNKARLNLVERILYPIYNEYKERAQLKNLEYTFTNIIENPFIYADEYTTFQIFHNLIDNAIKFTNKGFVRINVAEFSDGICITVSDSGIGISEEFINKIFSPFTQEEMGYTRNFEGNGLGLALVKKYCDLNAFDISLNSQKNSGSSFAVRMKKIA